MTQETKQCQNCKQDFVIEPEDFKFYEKIKVPPPTFCPECRLIRRLAWRNERSLYRRKCDKCEKSIISVFPSDSNLTVYCRPCWWSDDWDGTEYGIDFDHVKPFMAQLIDLLKRVPVMNLFGLYSSMKNSEYVNMGAYLKNCYFTTYTDYSENCSYSSFVEHSKDSYDNLMLFESELCYEVVNCQKCYMTLFSVDCEGCHDVSFSKNCVGCSDCIGCVNLRKKKYHIFNKPYSKEEYKKLAQKYIPSSHENNEKIKRQAMEFWGKFPNKYIHERHNNDVSGDYIDDSKNTHDTFIASGIENSRFCSFIAPAPVADSYDFTHFGNGAELVYDSLQVGDQASRVLFGWFVVSNVQDIEYSIFAIASKNLFGTVSLKKHEYCILNKQYSKEEYHKLREEIIEQMKDNPYVDGVGNRYSYGEFFPIELSPFGYNASTAGELFPISESEAKTRKYNWKVPEHSQYSITLSRENIPDASKEINDAILRKIIECDHKGTCGDQCTTAFKIIPDELAFYRRMNLPLPRLCPNCRHYQRLKQRNPFKLWHRQCVCDYKVYKNTIKHSHHLEDRCPNEFETSYSPERKEIVYCEECYQAEVV